VVISREKLYGVSAKRLAALSRRKLQAIRTLLAEIDAPWAEIDNSVIMDADELRAACDEFEKAIDRAVEYLKMAAE
jgi:hypothetical protein